MNLLLNSKIAEKYHNASQKVRVLTEPWVSETAYCPNCGATIKNYENNRPVADFFCPKCNEDYELKSKKDSLGIKITDGAYRTMIERLTSDNNPNLFLLNYNLKNLEVLNFLVIPKQFFIPNIIEKRKPLALTARRAGWVGCNILISQIPKTGKIYFVQNREIKPRRQVLENWQKTLFLREEKEISKKGWILDIMMCIEKLGKRNFSLSDIYAFENELSKKYPDNRHIKDKIRQQLQTLRNKNYLEFTGQGNYRLI